MGAGVAGVTTAFLLAERGYQVTVIDRQPSVAKECSYANGGQLSYSHVEPWAEPSVLPKVPGWLMRKDSPLVVRPSLSPGMWGWMFRFLACCTDRKAHETSRHMLRLSLYSRKQMQGIVKRTKLEFDYQQKGTLHLFSREKNLQFNIEQAKFLKNFGCEYEVLNHDGCVKLEPSLAETSRVLRGGVYFPMDESGDIHVYTTKLMELARKADSGVTFMHDTTIKRLHHKGDEITGVETDKGMVTGDIYVMAMGAYSPVFLSQLGISVPIYPLKGYSISIPLKKDSVAPEIALTDQRNKIVYSRLGDVLRVAGTAHICGYDHDIPEKRVETLRRMAKQFFPHLDDEINHASGWSCLRPSTPDGAPTLGKTHFSNLHLNTGHGTLGWTLSAGSAQAVVDGIDGKTPEIDLSGLDLKRYQ